MIHLLIDGYNLLYLAETGLITSLQERREKLLHRLHRYQAEKQVRITVVFDSAFQNPWGMQNEKFGTVYVVYTDANNTADDYIEKECDENPGGYVVVSNDRAVVDHAEARGCLTLSSTDFLKKLNAVPEEENPYLEDKEEEGPLYPRISTKKKGAAKKLPKKERRKQIHLRNL